MKNNYLWLLLTLAFFLNSCVQNKYIYKGQTLYRIPTAQQSPPPAEGSTTVPALSWNLETITVTNGGRVALTDKGDYLIIKPNAKYKFATNTPVSTAIAKAPQGVKFENSGKLYFPETDLVDIQAIKNKFSYFDSKPVLQALSVPVRIRPALHQAELKDSFPSQAEAGVNVGVAFGWKFQHNVFSSRKNVFGQNTNRYSFSPGIFLGVGATELKKANTRNPVIAFERKAAALTFGGFLMFGFNSINIGYAFGADWATGKGHEGWLYQGKLWHGFALSIDLIK